MEMYTFAIGLLRRQTSSFRQRRGTISCGAHTLLDNAGALIMGLVWDQPMLVCGKYEVKVLDSQWRERVGWLSSCPIGIV